jgi:hypothetical protein
MTVNAATVIARLGESEIPHEILTVGPGASIIVSSYGGRVYGPFFGDDVSENWIPEAFSSADAFAELIGSGFWNVGGERVWVGPEIAFMIPQRDDYWGSYTMPPSIDPGVHTIERDGDSIVLRRTATLESFVEPTGTTVIDVEIRVRAAQHPLRHLRGPFAHAATASFAGYTSEVTITQTSALPILAESWNLTQIPAGGIALVSTVPQAQVTDYYEPVGVLLQHITGGVAVKITGANRFKLGFAAPHVFGRVGYLTAGADGSATFLLRNSLSDPAAEYSEEPDFAVGHRGDPIHIYNDDGGLGGFAELEARGRPVSGRPVSGRPVSGQPVSGQPVSGTGGTGGSDAPTTSTDAVTSWWFRGERTAVFGIARSLTGIDPASINTFGSGRATLDEHGAM